MSTEFEKDVERLVSAAFDHGWGVRDQQEKNDDATVKHGRMRELYGLREFARKTVMASAPSGSAPLLTARDIQTAEAAATSKYPPRSAAWEKDIADRLNARLAHGEGKA